MAKLLNPPKSPTESVFVTWKLGRFLPPDIYVASATCTPSVVEGEDADVALMVAESAEITLGGTAVRQMVEVGVAGVLYCLSLSFTLTNGETYTECVLLPVEDACCAG